MSPLARACFILLVSLMFSSLDVSAFDRGEVEKFATLPAGSANPEGITADSHGNIYVTTFAVPPRPTEGQLIVFDRNGHLLRQLNIQGASSQLLGLAFHPQTGDLLVIDFGGAKVFKVNPFSGASSVFASVDPTSGAGLNALTFDKQGNVYISDSFRGIILRTNAYGQDLQNWVVSPLLQTSGVPPFGANGLGFSKNGSSLLVANTGNDQVIRIPVAGDGSPGTPEVLVNSINGADGLIVDKDDNIWVAANQADEIVVTDKTGRVIAKLGDFDGLDRRGAAKGFLFPASLVRHDGWIYVTNLALDLRLFGLPTVDSQWAAEVKSYTISRIRARIPGIRGLD